VDPPHRALLAAFGCTLALVLALLPAARAQTINPLDPSKMAVTQYKIDGWQTEQGLPQNTVQSMYQTRDGYLWVGTGGGLARFDGIRFTTFESSPVPELASRPIFGFMEDAQGALWIGHSRGATRYSDGRFERVIADDLMDGRRVWAFAQAPDGVIWAASENGLVRWEKGAVTKVYKEADGLPTKRLRTLEFDKDGTLWIGTTGGGLVSYASGRFEVMNPENGFPHLEVRHVLADPQGGIWAATAGAGLVRVNGKAIKAYTVADGLPTDQLTYLARDKAGSLWIGTWGSGVSRFRDGIFSSVSTAGGLAGDQIWSIHIDREGSLWVGTWHGGLNRRQVERTINRGERRLSDDVLSRHLPGLHVAGKKTTRRGLGRSRIGRSGCARPGAIGLRAIRRGRVRLLGQQRRHANRLCAIPAELGTGHHYARRLGDVVEPRNDTFQRLRLVNDLKLEERGLLDQFQCAFRVVDTRQLDNDAIVTRLLHQWLRDAELVDPLPHDLERALDRFRLVGNDLFGLVDLELKVHAALKIKAALEWYAIDRVIDKDAVALDALDDGPRKERPRGNREQSHDEQEAVLQVRHRCRWPKVDKRLASDDVPDCARAERGEHRRRRTARHVCLAF